jgi:GNAT superfamily N-acetyltransferase
LVEIRQASFDDLEQIDKFISDCYGIGAAYKRQPRIKWQFVDNPFQNRDDSNSSQLPIWIAVDRNRVVGEIALQPARARLESDLIDTNWVVDVMVHPEFRGKGLGHAIHDAICSTGKSLLTLTMAAATRRIAEKANCVTLGPVNQMVRVRRLSSRTIKSLVAERAENRPNLRGLMSLFNRSIVGPPLAAASISSAAAIRRLMSKRSSTSDLYSVKDVETFDRAAIEEIVQQFRSQVPALIERSYEFCQWRFRSAPDLSYRLSELKREGQIVGYAVWRLPDPIELNVGTLVDLIVAPDNQHGSELLIEHAVQRMFDSCEAVIAGASHPAVIAALAQQGFETVKIHRPTFVSTDRGLSATVERLKDGFYFSKADHDWDQIHPAVI